MRNFVRLIVLVVLLLPGVPGIARAQGPEPFALTQEMGRGAVQRAEWQTNGSLILVDTARGAWLYTSSLADAGFLPDARLARFSPDGALLAGVDPDNRIILWDANTLTKTGTLLGHAAYVRALEWSPDGCHLASLDRTGAIRVWDVAAAGDPLGLALEGADTLAWSKAGSYLAALDEATGHLEVWTINGTPVTSWGRPDYVSSYGYEMLWRDDSQLMWITNGEVTEGELWDSVTHTITPFDYLGYAQGFSPDGSTLITGSRAIEVDSGKQLFRVSDLSPSAISWSPNGRYIAFGTWTYVVDSSTEVRIVVESTGETLYTFPFEHTIESLHWSSDGTQLLVVDTESQLEVLQFPSPASQPRSEAHTTIGETAVWRDDGRLIAAADTLTGAFLWDAATGQRLGSRLEQGQPASQIAWQPGGTLLATAGGDGWDSLNNNVTIWEPDSEAPSWRDRVRAFAHLELITELAWSPDGRTLASAERRQYLHLWQPDTPDLIQIIDLWTDKLDPNIMMITPLDAIRWDRDSRQLLVLYSHRTGGTATQLIDVAGEPMLTVRGPASYDSTFAWTPDNRFIWGTWNHGYGCGGAPPIIRDITFGGEGIPYDPQAPLRLSGLKEQVAGGALNPDGTLLLGWDISGRGLLWDTATQAVQFSLDGVDDAAWAPDGSLLVVYGTDGVIRLLDPATGEVVQALARHFHDMRDRISGNPQVIWGADSQRFAVLDGGALFVYTRAG